MCWLVGSPGHQQQWYQLWKMRMLLPSLRAMPHNMIMWHCSEWISTFWCQIYCLILAVFTRCGPVTPYGDIDLGEHWLRVMACCLTAPCHYLKQCWLIFSEVLQYSSEDKFTSYAQDIFPCYQFESYQFNSLWPSDAVWWHISGSTLAQVMACCRTKPLPEPMLTDHQSSPVTLILGNFARDA